MFALTIRQGWGEVGIEHRFVGTILALGIAAGCALAQQEAAAEKHTSEIKAETEAKYPEGMANSALCQTAKGQDPPYSRFRWHEPNLAKLEKDLAGLMRESDEVVMVGTPLRSVTTLSPSGDDAVTYTDTKVLRSWKGFHKVGDVITFGAFGGTISCGPSRDEFSGTTVGPSPRFLYHTPNPANDPDGPYILFLKRPHENSPVEAFVLAGGDGVQGSFDLVPAHIDDRSSPYASCLLASFDQIACHSFAQHSHGLSPEWCRDSKIAQNIEQCNAAVSAGKEPVFVNGIDQDPLREKYQGKAISGFLRAVDATADAQARREIDQHTAD